MEKNETSVGRRGRAVIAASIFRQFYLVAVIRIHLPEIPNTRCSRGVEQLALRRIRDIDIIARTGCDRSEIFWVSDRNRQELRQCDILDRRQSMAIPREAYAVVAIKIICQFLCC